MLERLRCPLNTIWHFWKPPAACGLHDMFENETCISPLKFKYVQLLMSQLTLNVYMCHWHVDVMLCLNYSNYGTNLNNITSTIKRIIRRTTTTTATNLTEHLGVKQHTTSRTESKTIFLPEMPWVPGRPHRSQDLAELCFKGWYLRSFYVAIQLSIAKQ